MFLKFIISIVVPQLAGVVGSVFTASAIPNWYAGIEKSSLNPPGWVFGPVWVTLFLLMGIAMFLVWKRGFVRKDVKIALGMFGVQLVLNALWSVIFFGLQSPKWAFIEIFFLWFAIVATIIAFYRISKTAGWLLAPYILWVTFAGYLTYAVWMLN